jgi:hypothetical protein
MFTTAKATRASTTEQGLILRYLLSGKAQTTFF